jgi:SNF2 family DNA or RNA helicase
VNLFSHQSQAITWGVSVGSGLLADEPGLGKTATLASLADRCWDGGNVFVVCPRNVIKHWQKNFDQWAPKLSNRLFVTNYERLAQVPAQLNPTFVIVDESHKVKNETSERFKQLWTLCYNWQRAASQRGTRLRIFLASGTPVYSYPIDLMTSLLLIGQLDPSLIPAFKGRYCNPTRQRRGRNTVLDFRGASNLDELRRSCQPFVLRRTWEDAGIQMPAVTLTDLEVSAKISDPQYIAASSDFKSWYASQGKNPDGAGMARFTVLRRILAMAKTPAAIDQVCDDLRGGMHSLVFTGFRESAQTVHEAIKAQGYESFLVMGGQSIRERQALIEGFKASKCAALVATLDSISEGVDGLQNVCRIANFIDLDFEPAAFVQALRRVWRIGQRHPVTIRRFFIESDKMENFVQENLLKKERVQRQLGLEDVTSLSKLKGV